MRKRLSSSEWEQIKTAFATGSVSLRELGRQMNVAEGAILARASRERWTRQIQDARALAKSNNSVAITPVEAVSASIQLRGERHVQRVANIVEKTLPHVESMEPGAILDRAKDVDRLDRIGRRTYRLDKGEQQAGGAINIPLIKMDLR